MRLIKRYSNRKLYDTVSKSYITLETIATLIRNEERIQVIENDSNEDITSTILAQIIADETRKSKSYSPSLFVNMIQRSGDMVLGSAKKIVHSVGERAYSWEEEIQAKMKKIMSAKDSDSQADATDKPKRMSAYKKAEEQMELLFMLLLHKFNIPTKGEMEKLTQTVAKLEQSLQMLIQLQSANPSTSPTGATQSAQPDSSHTPLASSLPTTSQEGTPTVLSNPALSPEAWKQDMDSAMMGTPPAAPPSEKKAVADSQPTHQKQDEPNANP